MSLQKKSGVDTPREILEYCEDICKILKLDVNTLLGGGKLTTRYHHVRHIVARRFGGQYTNIDIADTLNTSRSWVSTMKGRFEYKYRSDRRFREMVTTLDQSGYTGLLPTPPSVRVTIKKVKAAIETIRDLREELGTNINSLYSVIEILEQD